MMPNYNQEGYHMNKITKSPLSDGFCNIIDKLSNYHSIKRNLIPLIP